MLCLEGQSDIRTCVWPHFVSAGMKGDKVGAAEPQPMIREALVIMYPGLPILLSHSLDRIPCLSTGRAILPPGALREQLGSCVRRAIEI